MGTRAAAIVAVVMVAGCGGYGAEAFHCESSAQCSGGACDTTVGFCTQPNGSCASGSAYTDHSGSYSGTCVGGGTTIDASIDGPPDAPPDAARLCYGSDPFMICLAAPPSSPLVISQPTKLDTTISSLCVDTTSGGANYCVVAATTISITAKLRGVGSKPLVLLASDSITISTSTTSGWIDVGNHRGDADLGAGADPTTTCMAGTPPGTRAGGAGGSFAGKGGNGGKASGGGVGGQAAAATTNITVLRGGCAGQGGDGGSPGAGGRGGGAVYLVAGNKIDITTGASANAGINAAGEGGSPGAPNANQSSGAGGGGSGGMILIVAPAITSDGLILANGGGGGEGSGETNAGAPGSDPKDTDPAVGGTGNPVGGNGGTGSSGAAAGNGTDGNDGINIGGADGGGGGGGGGAGLVKAPVSLGALVSPAVTSP